MLREYRDKVFFFDTHPHTVGTEHLTRLARYLTPTIARDMACALPSRISRHVGLRDTSDRRVYAHSSCCTRLPGLRLRTAAAVTRLRALEVRL